MPAGESQLKRAISRKMLLLLVVGDVLGAGIYALVGEVGGRVGGAMWAAFLLALILAAFTAFGYAELVTKYPQAAGAALRQQGLAQPVPHLHGCVRRHGIGDHLCRHPRPRVRGRLPVCLRRGPHGPRRFGGLAIAGAVYLLVTLVASAVVPTERLAASDGPLLEVVTVGPWPLPSRLFSAIALFALANGALINMIMASRVVYGMAREGILPGALGIVERRRGTPWVAILVTTGIAMVLIVSGDLGELADTTVLLLLLVFSAVYVAVLVLRRDRSRTTTSAPSRPYRSSAPSCPWRCWRRRRPPPSPAARSSCSPDRRCGRSTGGSTAATSRRSTRARSRPWGARDRHHDGQSHRPSDPLG